MIGLTEGVVFVRLIAIRHPNGGPSFFWPACVNCIGSFIPFLINHISNIPGADTSGLNEAIEEIDDWPVLNRFC